MAEDTEKKFQSIMAKLFSSPKSNLSLYSSLSPSSAQNTRGQKRLYSAMELANRRDKSEGIVNVAQAPPCRPWDREDLMRRLATFKSMAWFAKPKVMDAVNCARRGWINVDLDIIACEVCGARLQFSTPSSWNREQVEKAALVTSLKLDAGHKLLCPWINNACDENLAFFPPMPTSVLVDHYKERSSSLLQLAALPVISASVLESMRSPQLEHFLKQSITVECGEASNGSSWIEHLGNNAEALSAHTYYQAHRVLSLCGWEPRLLPYTVDCSDHSKQSTNSADLFSMSHVAAGEISNKLYVYVSDSGDSGKENGDALASGVYYNPNSTILECKLCGAGIGLWAFPTVPRPLELVRLVGYTEIDGRDSEERKKSGIENNADNGRTDYNTVKENKLSLTIAGGPPPMQQNFRARISLPVVGRNVRARLSYELSQLRNTSEQVHTSLNIIEEGLTENMQNADAGSSRTDNLAAVENTEVLNYAIGGSDVFGIGQQDNVAISEFFSAIVVEGSNLQQKPLDSTAVRKETSSVAIGGQEKNESGDTELALQKDVSTTSIERDSVRHFPDEKMAFDPISRHRHFCPWVKSSGSAAPGWQQTLSALQKEKVFLLPESKDSASSPSLIKVDDPITSIRKLFESSPSKRAKLTSA